MNSKFEEELQLLINKYSKENDSNTPDFILAKYLNATLNNFNIIINDREKWYGKDTDTDLLDWQDEILKDTSGNPPPIIPSTTNQDLSNDSSSMNTFGNDNYGE